MEIDRRGKGADMPERYSRIAVNFFVRAIVGFAIIFFVNQYLEMKDISVSVGLNPITFVTSGTLGAPGVALLYGISFYKGL